MNDMTTKTQSTFDDLLLEQSLDHILNSPDDEFFNFTTENDMDVEELKFLNKSAAESVLAATEKSLEINSNSTLKTDPFIERLVAAAKRLNFPLTKKDFQDWSEDSFNTQMAYSRSQKDKRTRVRKVK